MKKLESDFVNEQNMGMLIDLYELTMCASYLDNKKNEQATFDLFIRKMPSNRSYFIFAGLEQVLLFLKNIRFTQEQIGYLKAQGFKQEFLNYLKNFKFTGDVWTVPEGTIVFQNEPLMRVTAPIIEAQLIESFILNAINIQTMVATKASRVVHAARGRPVVDFSLRRTHGTDAGMKVARASYMAGCAGTSNVLAGMKYGIPIFGTMAHSFVMLFDKEIDSFRAFAKTFPKKSTLLIDTYDDLKGVENAAIVAKELEKNGFKLSGVRLDSGDLLSLSKKVRIILDEKGLNYVKIFASGDLDEYEIKELLDNDAKIDAFGVGTRMGTSHDKPSVDVVYKLCERMGKTGEFIPAMKLSKNKATFPGRKQIFRVVGKDGFYERDVIGLEDERIDGKSLLIKVMSNGKIVYDLPELEDIKKTTLENLSKLPESYKKLKNAPNYPVKLGSGLEELVSDQTRRASGGI